MGRTQVGSIAILLAVACSNGGGSGSGTSGSGSSGGTSSGGTSSGGTGGGTSGGTSGGSSGGATGTASTGTGGAPVTQSNIEHLVVIIQENHTFDNYFGQYCTAATGSNPTCTTGPSCCEAAPAMDPSGATPITLDDAANSAYDPVHLQMCELGEMNGGAMDQYAMGTNCSDPRNVAYADPTFVKTYTDLAAAGALADRYFQPIVGQSSSNDMYFARANYVFTDNELAPPAIGESCELGATTMSYSDQTIADLLVAANVPWAWYGEGYKEMVDAGQGMCPNPPADCSFGLHIYPCVYDPSDVPFQYYDSLRDNPEYMRDYGQLADDLQGDFPSVVFVKGYGFHTEHPGYGDTITDGMTFVQGVLDAVNGSSFASSTLILLTYDEGGGFFDHVTPPPDAMADGKPYGTRVPMIAIGPFAKQNEISHVVMEHSSVVKFIEWNWLGGMTGQLGTRDAEVNNIGSLLDPAATGTAVPEN